MSFLIAKKYNTPGCIAVQVERGEKLAKIVTDLGRTYVEQGIQILTVSSIEAYGEYRPYTLLGSLEEFVCKVKNMATV